MKNRVVRAVFAAALVLLTALTVSADEGGLSIENPVWRTDAPDSWYVPRPLFLQEILWDKDGWPYFGNGGKPL